MEEVTPEYDLTESQLEETSALCEAHWTEVDAETEAEEELEADQKQESGSCVSQA